MKEDAKKAAAVIGAGRKTDKEGDSEHEVFFCFISKSKMRAAAAASSSSWIIDSACTAHMTFDLSLFVSYTPLKSASIQMSTSDTANATVVGDVIIEVCIKGELQKRKLRQVLHVPNFRMLAALGSQDGSKRDDVDVW